MDPVGLVTQVVADKAVTVEQHYGQRAVLEGEFHDSAWYTVERSNGRLILAILAEAGEVREITRLPEREPPRLSSSPEGLLVSMRDAPFETLVLDQRRELNMLLEPVSLPALKGALEATPGANWEALNAIRFTRGYLQTIADLRSDERLLVIYSEDGEVLRYRKLGVPIGIASASSTAREVFGIRGGGVRELVVYSWE